MKKTALGWMIRQVNNRMVAIIAMLISYVGAALLGVAFALGSKKVIDTAVEGAMNPFVDACILQAVIIIGIIVCTAVYRHLKDRLTADLDRDWKKKLLHKLMHGEYASVSKYHSAELINRMNNDVRILDDGIVTIIPNVAGMVTRLGAAATALAVLDLKFTLCLLAAGVVLIIGTGIMRGLLKELNKKVSEHEGKVSAFIQEALENLLVVQAMDAADEMSRRADKFLDDRYRIQRKRKNVSLFANTGVSIISYAATFAALVWCSYGLVKGVMTFGTLMAITQLVAQLRGPLVNMSGIMPQYAAMTAAAERLMEIENLPDEPKAVDNDVTDIYDKMTAISCRDLSFSYDEDEKILDDISFRLKKGTFTAITGSSGAGKSTILKLLLGIYMPDKGRLIIEKVGGEEENLDRAARRIFAYVPQKNLLFSGTVRENLTVVKPEATEEEINHAVYVSCMDEYIDQLPSGLDTVLGEKGAGTSEGQAQRLAIARAILGGAPILLLDESTSALDPQLEKEVLDRIKGLEDRMCIAVTHRPAALKLADMQLDMSEGSGICQF